MHRGARESTRLDRGTRARFTSGRAGPGRVDVCTPPRRPMLVAGPLAADHRRHDGGTGSVRWFGHDRLAEPG